MFHLVCEPVYQQGIWGLLISWMEPSLDLSATISSLNDPWNYLLHWKKKKKKAIDIKTRAATLMALIYGCSTSLGVRFHATLEWVTQSWERWSIGMFTQGKRFNFSISKMKHWVDEQKVNSLTSLPLIVFSGYCCQATPTQDIWFGYLWAPGGLLYLLKELNKVNGSRLYPSFNLKSSYPVKCLLPSPAATRASSKLWPFFF